MIVEIHTSTSPQSTTRNFENFIALVLLTFMYNNIKIYEKINLKAEKMI